LEQEVAKLLSQLTNDALGEDVKKLIEQNINDFQAQISLKNSQLEFQYQAEKQLHQLLYDDYLAVQLASHREILDKLNEDNIEDFKKIEVKKGFLETNQDLLHKIQSTLIYLEDRTRDDISITKELEKEIRNNIK